MTKQQLWQQTKKVSFWLTYTAMKILNNVYRLVLILIILAVFGTPLFLMLSREYEEWKIVHDCLKEGHMEEYCKKSLEELLPS